MSLISDLNDHAGKTAYQSYTISHGIERMQVLVPLEKGSQFEADLGQNFPTRQAVVDVITKHGGIVK